MATQNPVTVCKVDKNGNSYAVYDPGRGQSFNREAAANLPAVPGTGTPGSFTWPSGSRPTSLDISLLNVTNGESQLWVCFDAPDAATADVWLEGAAGTAVDSQRYIVTATTTDAGGAASLEPIPGRKTTFSFTAGLSNMYYILQSADNGSTLLVEAS